MKKAKKVVALALCAVMLVVGSVAGTMAYLTSQDAVTNTFTVGNVAITLDEADVKPDGTYETNVDARVDSNEYHLMPGHTYIKDPVIHVDENSENCYLFVKLENGLKGIIDAQTIEDQMINTYGWMLINENENIYAKANPVEAGADVQVFANFKLTDDAVTSTLVDSDNDGVIDAQINVTACAVQADGLTLAEAAAQAEFE